MRTRQVGVEEEFILVDTATGRPSAVAPQMLARTDDPRVKREFKQEQVELASDPCASMGELASELARLREQLAALAATQGAVLVASGTWPGVHQPTTTPSSRFTQITSEFGQLADQQLTCGMHVHVEVESPEEGVIALDRIRPWLSLLTALTANSPYWQGNDTGYASYRSIVLAQLPTAGPTDVWGDLAVYRAETTALVQTGAAFDEGMLYYDARLSARYPTVEIRVTDVSPHTDDAVMVAALCRALVSHAVAQQGRPPPQVSTAVLRAAAWRAARHGMTGDLVVPALAADPVPAWEALWMLVNLVHDELMHAGDAQLVQAALERIRCAGTGSERQRHRSASGACDAWTLEIVHPNTIG